MSELIAAQSFHVKGRGVNEEGDSVKNVTVRINGKETKFGNGIFDLMVFSNDSVLISSPLLKETNITFHSPKDNIIIKLKYFRTKKGELIYDKADQMPEFPGGVDSLMQFISATLQYPNTEADVTGMIITMFTVEKSGKISDIKLLRGIEKDYDNEALRIIKLMPDWIPGKKNGKPVNVKTIVPIRFLLK